MEVTGAAATTSCLERRFLKRFVQCHVFAQSPPRRRPSDKYPYSDLCKNVSFAILFGLLQSALQPSVGFCLLILFGSSSNSCTISAQTDTCICTCSSQHRDAGRAKVKNKIGTAVNAACHFWYTCHRFDSPDLGLTVWVQNMVLRLRASTSVVI